MFDTPAKRVRENCARAKSALMKGNVPKSIHHCLDAIKDMQSKKIFGREKFETEIHLQEYLKDFNRHPDVKKYFVARSVHVTPYCKYVRGKEQELTEFFLEVVGEMEFDEKHEENQAEEKRERRKDELLDKAQQFLDAKEFPKGKSIIRRVVEEFGHEEGVLTDCGGRLLKAKLYFEAGEILEEAIAKNSRDSHALAWAVQAYRNAREYPKMEQMYKIALKTFGTHPKTLMHMAEMYLEWHKYDEAYDFAKQALAGDSSLEKAQEIMETTAKRIF